MTKMIVGVIATAMLASCATPRDDYALQWEDQSSRLYVYSPDGSLVSAVGAQLISVPGYVFSQGAIVMHPGETTIGYNCPSPDGLVVLDAMPEVRHVFEAGRSYELRCKDGAPVISERR